VSTKTKEDRGTMHTVTDSDDPSTGGWRFFLWWMLASSGRDPTDAAACSKVGTKSGESWRLAPALIVPMGIPFPSTAVERLVPCLPLSSTGLLPAFSPPRKALW
jgi:hypothetical protein